MHKFLISITLICAYLVTQAQLKIDKPTLNSNHKAFAIIVDQDTYLHVQDAVKAYQKTIETDGLPTYIISGVFNKPDDVKKEIVKLYKTKQSLEGVVFIGEIPIPMIRKGQYFLPSDRFYDDFNLAFEYIKQDSEEGRLHYYKLTEGSPQKINPAIYSARICYPGTQGTAAYEAITNYLQKVVRTRRDNILDHFVALTEVNGGPACHVAWKDNLKIYGEHFPFLAKNVNGLKQLLIQEDNPIMLQIPEEMHRKEVDLCLLQVTANKQNTRKKSTHPLHIILDTDTVGYFENNHYTACAYIFNTGNTIAVQTNTAESRGMIDHNGLLSYGVRLGHVHKLNLNLQNHLFGDPTFHFSMKENEKLNEKLSGEADIVYWNSLLKKDNPVYQALALHKLATYTPNYSSTLLDCFNSSRYRAVRLQSLKLLASYNNDHFRQALSKGLTDEYEMIAYQAAVFAGKTGDTTLIAPLAAVWVADRSRLRVQHSIAASLSLFNKKCVEKVLTQVLSRSDRINKEGEIAALHHSFMTKTEADIAFDNIMDKSAAIDLRLACVRAIADNNYHEHIHAYFDVIRDKNEPIELRVALTEVLSAFTLSLHKNEILAQCHTLLKSKIPKELKQEVEQTINKLN